MSYKVISNFRDLEDKRHRYKAGDVYPREGYEPSKSRIEELASNKNKQKKPLIKEVEFEEVNDFPKHTGGGWYELSNGEKVQGKDEAITAEKEL